MTSAIRQIGNMFWGRSRFQVAVLVGKTHHGIGVSNVDPLRIWSRRIKRDAIRTLQSGGEGFGLGFPSLVIPRKTFTSPGSDSATKKSPFGAVTISRGLFSPLAYCCTLKPGSVFGHASLGRATTFAPLSADFVAKGCGKSCTVILRTVPGFSKR